MLLPIGLEQARYAGLSPPPADHIYQLPLAIYDAGVSLRALRVEISAPENISDFIPNEETLHRLTGAVQQLKYLDFRP